MIVVNTCGFIGEAKKESIDTIFEMAELKKQRRAARSWWSPGCLSQRYPDELAREMPEVDHFLGSSDMLKLGEVLARRAPSACSSATRPTGSCAPSDPRVLTRPRAAPT